MMGAPHKNVLVLLTLHILSVNPSSQSNCYFICSQAAFTPSSLPAIRQHQSISTKLQVQSSSSYNTKKDQPYTAYNSYPERPMSILARKLLQLASIHRLFAIRTTAH